MTNFAKLVPLASIMPINQGLHSASEETMISILGRPQMPLTTFDQPARASETVKKLRAEKSIFHHVTGIRPAVVSLETILKKVDAAEPGLMDVLRTQGMLNVRLRKPIHGTSTKISNHAWGTAIDFNLVGQNAPGDNADMIPQFIAALVKPFNEAGWYSGIAFHDDMHFEVAEETIVKWSHDQEFA